jgi:hypothetical protein
MQGVFGADAAEVFEEDEGRNYARNARVHVATYQTLGIDREEGDPSFLFRHYPENYFSHIVIDECHRSAWGKWSVVLTRNPKAVQIGLTATPRQIECDEDTREAKADAEVTADNLHRSDEQEGDGAGRVACWHCHLSTTRTLCRACIARNRPWFRSLTSRTIAGGNRSA